MFRISRIVAITHALDVARKRQVDFAVVSRDCAGT